MANIYYFCCLSDFDNEHLNFNVSDNKYIHNYLKTKEAPGCNIIFEFKLIKNGEQYIITEILYQNIGLYKLTIEDHTINIHDDTISPNVNLDKKNGYSIDYDEYLSSNNYYTLLIPYEKYEKHKLMNNLTDNFDNVCKLLDYLEDTYYIKLDEINNVINK